MTKNQKDDSSTNKYYIAFLIRYTLLFVITAAGVCIWFILENKSMCWEQDAVSQYVPKAVYFIRNVKAFVKRLLQGEFSFRMYDFSLGFGDNVTIHTEPVYWLYLLFHEKQIEVAYGILILLRFYLAGLAFSAYSLYMKMGQWETLLASMVYIFSGYGLYAGMRHSHFIVPMIMLPLLILSIEEIYRQKRWYLCTIFVALSFWAGYYFTYMHTFFMGIYFLVRFFFGEETKGVKQFLRKSLVISASYILGIGISNITIFNSFAGYLLSSRTGSDVKENIRLTSYGAGWIAKVYQSFLTTQYNTGSWLWLGYCVIVYFCVVLLLLRKGNRQLKIGLCIGVLFCMFPIFAYIFSGFSTVTNRWSYALAFLFALITAKMIKELLYVSKKEIMFLFLSILPYLYFGIGKCLLHMKYVKSVRDAGILLLITFLLIAVCHFIQGISCGRKRSIVTVAVVIFLWFSSAFRFAPYYTNQISEFAPAGEVYALATNTPLKVLSDSTDGEAFFRSYSRTINSNVQGASMMLGFNGILYFTSTLSKVCVDYFKDLGISSWHLVRLIGLDGRGFLNALASVRYEIMDKDNPYDVPYGYVLKEERECEGKTYLIYETDRTLPIGYTYDKVIPYDEFQKLSTIERQEVMLQAAVIDNADEFVDMQQVSAEERNKNYHVTSKKMNITNIVCEDGIEFDGKKLEVTKANAALTVYFEGLDNSETYLSFENLHMDMEREKRISLESDSKTINVVARIYGDKNLYNTKQKDYMFNLGYSEKGKTFCRFSFSSKCTMTVDELSVYCQPMSTLDLAVKERKEHSMTDISVDTNRVSGKITTVKNEFLVFSIPYASGWKVYVDGEKEKLYQADVMYMGVKVEKGSHDIVLEYKTPGIALSLCVTFVSLILFILFLVVTKRRVKR